MNHVVIDPEIAAPGTALGAVRFARRGLMDAQFRLADSGLQCALLDHIASDAGALISVWTGRTIPQPNPPEMQSHIARSSLAWRVARRARR